MNGRDSGDRTIVDWPASRPPRRRLLWFLVAIVAALLLSAGTAVSYYVDALWFESLGYLDVFWKTLNIQAAVFLVFAGATFAVLYGSYVALKPAQLADLAGGTIIINGQPVRLPLEPAMRLIALGLSLVIAVATGAGMMADWTSLALYWYGGRAERLGAAATAAAAGDPIFGRPLTFYLFTLPAWNAIVGWLLTLSIIVCAIAIVFVALTGGSRLFVFLGGGRMRDTAAPGAWRGLSIGVAAALAMLAVRVYLSRFEAPIDQ